MGEVIGTLNNQKRREIPSFKINTFNYRNPFLITRLDGFSFTLWIGASNY